MIQRWLMLVLVNTLP